MKKIALLLCAIVMFGCSDDEEKVGTEVPDPEISKMLFSEFCKSDGIGVSDVTKEEEFRYEDAWLTGYTYTQEVSIADLTEIISHSLTIQYGNNRSSVTFTDEIGTERKYTLNEEGYATQCEYASLDQKRQYTFLYTDGYLTQVNEKIMPREGSSDAVVAHTLSLQYDKGDLISTISPSLPYESSTGYGKLQTNYEAGEDINYYRLPCMLVADTYPLSFHREALFAGMLGKPTQHLTTASCPNEPSDTYTERTEYTYSFDKNKKPVSLKISTKYSNGKSTSYLNRTISITIE